MNAMETMRVREADLLDQLARRARGHCEVSFGLEPGIKATHEWLCSFAQEVARDCAATVLLQGGKLEHALAIMDRFNVPLAPDPREAGYQIGAPLPGTWSG